MNVEVGYVQGTCSRRGKTLTGPSAADVILKDEEKIQLNTRIKIEGTVDKAVFEEFKRIYELEIEKAEAEDKVQPSVSHILEMLLRKGIRMYKKERKQ